MHDWYGAKGALSVRSKCRCQVSIVKIFEAAINDFLLPLRGIKKKQKRKENTDQVYRFPIKKNNNNKNKTNKKTDTTYSICQKRQTF